VGPVPKEEKAQSPPTPGHTLITTSDDIHKVVSAVEDGGGSVGLLCVASGQGPVTPWPRLVLVSTDKHVFVIDVFALPDPSPKLAPLLVAMSRVTVVGSDLQAALRSLARLGLTPLRVFDVMLASQILYAGQDKATKHQQSHNLGSLMRRELGSESSPKLPTSDWSGQLTSEQLLYAATEASEPVKKSVSNQSRRLRMESETACHVVGDGEPRRSGFDLFETSNQELP